MADEIVEDLAKEMMRRCQREQQQANRRFFLAQAEAMIALCESIGLRVVREHDVVEWVPVEG